MCLTRDALHGGSEGDYDLADTPSSGAFPNPYNPDQVFGMDRRGSFDTEGLDTEAIIVPTLYENSYVQRPGTVTLPRDPVTGRIDVSAAKCMKERQHYASHRA